MRTPLLLIAAAFVAATPLASHNAESSSCRAPRDPAQMPGAYPEHPLSPYESLKNFDSVFLGEVVVPARKCSLGWCAGLKVLKTVKGQPGSASLVQITTDGPCGPTDFLTKGARWVVFANQGTSHGGLQFLATSDDGPSFAAAELPDFGRLEDHYRMRQAQLDRAIDERLGRLR